MNGDNLERMIKKRGVVRASTTKLLTKLEKYLLGEYDVAEVEELVDQLVNKELTLQSSLDNEVQNLLELEHLEEDMEVAMAYTEKIITWKRRVNRRLQEQSLNHSLKVIPQTKNKVHARLPKLELKKFYGDSSEWQEFFNQFESSVMNNESLTKTDKFSYLKALLEGTAANSISGLSLSSENFDAAINILSNRFGRKDIMISAHVNKLLNIDPVKCSTNVIALRKLYDTCEVQIRSLESLNVTSGSFGNLLCPILLRLIPNDMTLEFTRKRKSTSDFDIKELMEFIRVEIESREATLMLSDFKNMKLNTSEKKKDQQCDVKRRNNLPTASSFVTNLKTTCIFCKSGAHRNADCNDVAVDDKRKMLINEGRCFRKGHLSSNCWVKMNPCEICNRKNHNKSLCHARANIIGSSENQAVVSTVSQNALSQDTLEKSVLLQTFYARIIHQSNTRIIRCLLDNGSQRSFVTKRLADELNLQTIREERLLVFSFGTRELVETMYDVAKINLQNVERPEKNITIEVLISRNICGTILQVPDQTICKFMRTRKMQFAECYFTSKKEINILIGADYLWKINSGRNVKVSRTIVAVDTLFGWTVQGLTNGFQKDCVATTTVLKAEIVDNGSLYQLMKTFWDLESLGINENMKMNSNHDDNTIKEFEKNLKFVNGRYEAKLLWKDQQDLKDNFDIAKQRFYNLRSRLKKNTWLFTEYKNILDDQMNENIIEECDSTEKNENKYYMPHHAVVKKNKMTSKVRIVFDASCKGSDGKSLNDCLLSGPNLNPNILDIILKFRQHRIAFCADIEKAFLQIGISEEERNYLRFFWFNDKSQENGNSYKILRMTRVPFGVTTSPFILAATIKHHIRKYETEMNDTFKMLNNSLYEDDLFYGTNSVNEAFKLSSSAFKILKDAGMNLRKFRTNSLQLLSKWQENGIVKDETFTENCLKVLGINWNVHTDVIKLEMKSIFEDLKNKRNTKRYVLQTAARIFDPAGYISPFIIRVKCLIQELWERGFDWDVELPNDLRQKWDQWCSEFKELENLSIRRRYFSDEYIQSRNKMQVHIFSDASPKAYGIVAYFRNISRSYVKTSFVMSKSRVSPLKKLSLPRLELMGVVIGARVVKYLKDLFEIDENNVYIWTDSAIVL